MIAVLGTGRMGGALGSRLTSVGAEVVYGSREPESERVQELVNSMSGVKAATIAEAVEGAETVVLAVPYAALGNVLEELNLGSQIVVDATNALTMADDGLMEFASTVSAGEEVQSTASDTKVVKAFNTVGFHVVADPAVAGGPVSVPIAGNDEDAKQTVAALVERMGFECVDVGPIRQARYLEGMSALYLTPYLQGRAADAFEYHLRVGTRPKVSSGVRAAG